MHRSVSHTAAGTPVRSPSIPASWRTPVDVVRELEAIEEKRLQRTDRKDGWAKWRAKTGAIDTDMVILERVAGKDQAAIWNGIQKRSAREQREYLQAQAVVSGVSDADLTCVCGSMRCAACGKRDERRCNEAAARQTARARRGEPLDDADEAAASHFFSKHGGDRPDAAVRLIDSAQRQECPLHEPTPALRRKVADEAASRGAKRLRQQPRPPPGIKQPRHATAPPTAAGVQTVSARTPTAALLTATLTSPATAVTSPTTARASTLMMSLPPGVGTHRGAQRLCGCRGSRWRCLRRRRRLGRRRRLQCGQSAGRKHYLRPQQEGTHEQRTGWHSFRRR